MTAIVELVRKGIIEDATSADSRRVFAMAMALIERRRSITAAGGAA